MMPERSGGHESTVGNLATALDHIAGGRFAEAEAVCRATVVAHPDDPQAWHLLGGIALQQGDADRAIEHCRRAISLAPKLAKAHSNLGAALAAKGRLDEAIAALQTAIDIDPRLVSAYVNLGDALMKADRFEEAVVTLERAVSLDPANTPAQLNLGAALTRQNRVGDALAILARVVEQNPGLPQAHNNLGFALQKNAEYEKALAALLRAQELNPALVDVCVNLGGVYRALGRFDDSVAAYSRALELRPGFPDAALFRSMILLGQGQFAVGWRDYLNRLSVRGKTPSLHRQPLAPDLTGVRLFLCRDQGLGDEIFFMRFAPELKRRGAHLTYQAHAKIASLLRRLPFLDVVVTEDIEPGALDTVVSIGDLPFLLGMASASDIPPSIELSVPPDRLEAQRSALAALGPPPYIGVTWRAGTDQSVTLYKSAPLERIGAVLRQTKGTLVALQRLPESGEIETLSIAAGRPVHDFTAVNSRLEDMLALVSLLDDYVTVSNTNVHLRAATGKGSRVLVPWPADFRWMMDGRESPWFPECTVYRQQHGGSWDAAFSALASDLMQAMA